MSEMVFKKAEPGDSVWAGERLLETMLGFGVNVFGLGSKKRALEVLSSFFEKRTNRLSYQYSYIAQIEGNPAGLLLILPGSRLMRANLATAVQVFSVYRFAEIAELVKRTIHMIDEEKAAKDELYVGNVAVSPQFRRRGIGHKLLEFAENFAIENEMKKLSLMVEIENSAAIALYEKYGFLEKEKYLNPDHLQETGSLGSVKMVKEI